MPQDKPRPVGANYGLTILTGTEPTCWFFTLTQGPQTFSLYAETEEEKKNYIRKLQLIKRWAGDTLKKLETPE